MCRSSYRIFRDPASRCEEPGYEVKFFSIGGNDYATNRKLGERGVVGFGTPNQIFIRDLHEVVHTVKPNPFERDAKGLG